MTPAITVEGLSKRYEFADERPFALRELADSVLRRPMRSRTVAVNALSDVSFEVQEGEAFGIVGRNGAGKSTLLQILARITAPTSGRAVIHGRLAAILGIGAGFHPELSGRENIFMNAAVLGVRTAVTARAFDEIVAFSELEEFIDMPVKRYSSGMQARLGFAVAAHLDPEVLLLDEVLAVGDRIFKEKCHARVDQVTGNGRTVVLVSHDMSSILDLCPRALVLESGKVAFLGSSADATAKYSTMGGTPDEQERRGTGEIRIATVRLSGSAGDALVETNGHLRVMIELEATRPVDPTGLTLKIRVLHARRGVLGQLSTQVDGDVFDREVCSGDIVTCDVDHVPFKPGEYSLSARLERQGELVDELERCGSFWVVNRAGEPKLPKGEGDPGFLALRHRWTVSEPLQPV